MDWLIYSLDQPIHGDSTLMVELVYVELLEYKLGKVNYNYPNDYDIIADSIDRSIDLQKLQFRLLSDRTITDIKLLSHTADSITNTGTGANIFYSISRTEGKPGLLGAVYAQSGGTGII